jgi:enoyl-CoA hydratase/carnithine racemase
MDDAARPAPVLLRDEAERVVTLTLNRPAQYNALSADLLAALERELDAIAADDSVRVVVIAGAGRAFCAGHDLKELQAERSRPRVAELFERCSRIMQALVALPQPVIARVHGIATAAGCQLVAQCDLAVAAADARFATSGIHAGLFCATPAVPLSRNLPRKQAFRMLVTGEFIDAGTALAQGLVNEVVPAQQLDSAVARLAHMIVGQPRAALAAGKRLFYRQLPLDLAGAYQAATESMVCGVLAADGLEGIDAFVEKRAPRWQR